jgi:uncharacterized protein (TIGR02001 family)
MHAPPLLAAPLLAAAALAALLPTTAFARSGGDWRSLLTIGTDNRSKDESKSAGRPFVAGLAEWTDASGLFYAGPGFETIDDNGADVELNGVAGVRPEWRGFDLNFSATYKWRVVSDPGVDDTEFELTADASRSVGPASARVRVQYAPDAGGATDSFTWVETRLGWELTPTLEATATVGQRDRHGGTDSTSWNVGVAWDLTDALQLDLRYHDTNQEQGGVDFADRVVAAVFVTF